MNLAINVVWLPRKNIGLFKEVDTLNLLLRNQGGPTIHLSNMIEVIKLMCLKRLRGQSVTLFVYNISALSCLVLLFSRCINVRVVQFLHEPGMENKLNYGYIHALKIVLVEFLVSVNVYLSDYIVTFSNQAYEITTSNFPGKKVYCVQLLPYYELPKLDTDRELRYALIYIGSIHPAKNFLVFLELARLIFEFSGLKSRLISRSSRYIKNEGIDILPFLDVEFGHSIPDEVIERGLCQSSVLFKMDKNMMQSGLVAQAMYFGAVCVLNDIEGFRQDFHPLLHLIFKPGTATSVIANEILLLHKNNGTSAIKNRIEVCRNIHDEKLETWNKLFRGVE